MPRDLWSVAAAGRRKAVGIKRHWAAAWSRSQCPGDLADCCRSALRLVYATNTGQLEAKVVVLLVYNQALVPSTPATPRQWTKWWPPPASAGLLQLSTAGERAPGRSIAVSSPERAHAPSPWQLCWPPGDPVCPAPSEVVSDRSVEAQINQFPQTIIPTRARDRMDHVPRARLSAWLPTPRSSRQVTVVSKLGSLDGGSPSRTSIQDRGCY